MGCGTTHKKLAEHAAAVPAGVGSSGVLTAQDGGSIGQVEDVLAPLLDRTIVQSRSTRTGRRGEDVHSEAGGRQEDLQSPRALRE